MQTEFDYIIIGAGSAGCTLANRLSAEGRFDIALIEAGGSNKSVFVKMPSALSIPMHKKRFNWGFESVAEPYLDGRVIPTYRGKGLGGSSAINGMVFVRGHPKDFDEWEAMGAQGWNYQNCLPYFKKLENWQGGPSQHRGGLGPVKVTTGNNMALNPLYRAFIEAGVQAGYPRCEDYNGQSQEGFGQMQMNVDGGERASTAKAYLDPIRNRANLTILKHTLTHKVLIKDGRAKGVWVSPSGSGGAGYALKARRDVILSAGSIGSPQILQHSGIGPKTVLEKAGIKPILIREGVGENLSDHLEIFFQYKCLQPVTLNAKLGLISKALIGARWLVFKDGLGATNHFESCGFIRSSPQRDWPDIQFHFLPGAVSYDGNTAFKGHGYQVHVGPNKPASRGHIRIRDAHISTPPQIQFNYLKEARDIEDWRATIRLTRMIMQGEAFGPYRGDEIQPGKDVVTDGQIDEWVRENAESAYHPSCSNRMGQEDDPLAVVNHQCQLIGLKGLRVVDSSIFPSIPNGNLNAPTMMLAERAADIILGNIAT